MPTNQPDDLSRNQNARQRTENADSRLQVYKGSSTNNLRDLRVHQGFLLNCVFSFSGLLCEGNHFLLFILHKKILVRLRKLYLVASLSLYIIYKSNIYLLRNKEDDGRDARRIKRRLRRNRHTQTIFICGWENRGDDKWAWALFHTLKMCSSQRFVRN